MSPCRIWQGSKTTLGYGRRARKVDGRWREFLVHREACWEAYGPPPPDKPYALHSCDNPSCYEPSHLRWGSPRENLQDAIDRGRMRKARGEACSLSKLTEPQVKAIKKALRLGGRTQQSIAEEFGVQQSNIAQIKRGASWAHVGEDP